MLDQRVYPNENRSLNIKIAQNVFITLTSLRTYTFPVTITGNGTLESLRGLNMFSGSSFQNDMGFLKDCIQENLGNLGAAF
jgi:hypothetical protein